MATHTNPKTTLDRLTMWAEQSNGVLTAGSKLGLTMTKTARVDSRQEGSVSANANSLFSQHSNNHGHAAVVTRNGKVLGRDARPETPRASVTTPAGGSH